MALQVFPNQSADVLVATILAVTPGLSVIPGTATITIIPSTSMVNVNGTFGPSPYAGTAVNSGRFTGGLVSGAGSGPASIGGLPWDTGIILSTGKAVTAIGPNTSHNAGTNLLTGNANSGGGITLPQIIALHTGAPSDDAIQAIANGLSGGPHLSFDACALQFDFVPAGNQIYFEYVFASEEYPEFVGSVYNDQFLLMLNGVNIAFLPGTSIPVTINAVNGTTGTAGSQKYFQGAADVSPWTTDAVLEYDGFVGAPLTTNTVPNSITPGDGSRLYALASVTPGVRCHIKFVIGDLFDSILDSAVFIGANTFQSLFNGAPVNLGPEGAGIPQPAAAHGGTSDDGSGTVCKLSF